MARIKITGYVDTSTWTPDHFDREGLLGLSSTGHQRLMRTPVGAFAEWGSFVAEASSSLDELSTEDLVAQLDSSSRNDSDDARDVLIERGPAVVPAVLAAVPGMGAYGKLSAIEVLTDLPDPAAGPVLADLLSDTDDVVRTWAAELLGSMGHVPAVPALRALHARMVEKRVPLDWMGPSAVRDALTALGARPRVTPALTASLAVDHGGHITWPATALRQVADDLADHDLLLLVSAVHFWDVGADGALTRSTESIASTASPPWPVDWPHAVNAARERAHHVAALVAEETTAVMTIDWLVRGDVERT